MTERKTLRRSITGFLIAANICWLLMLFSGGASPHNTQGNKKTIIRRLPVTHQPLDVSFELGGQPVESKKAVLSGEGVQTEEFEADKDWLKHLSLKLTNKTNKAITYIVLDVLFPETANVESPRVGLHQIFLGVDYDQKIHNPELRLGPHESVEVPFAERHEHIKSMIQFKIPIEQVTQMEIRIHDVLFEDGTLFETGDFFKRNPDANDPKKWIKIDN
jgi:hypothetical protein